MNLFQGIDRRLLALLGLVLALAVWGFGIGPLLDRSRELTARIDRAERQGAQLTALEERTKSLAGSPEAAAPSANGTRDLFSFLRALAENLGATGHLESIAPATPESASESGRQTAVLKFSRIPLSMLADFLYRLESDPLGPRVRQFSCRPDPIEGMAAEMTVEVARRDDDASPSP